jgi:hypothetical protein
MKLLSLLFLTLTLAGCISAEERRARAEQWQRYVNQCNDRGGVIYRNTCMSAQDARVAQQQDFIAAEREKDRVAMQKAACISRGGTWMQFSQQCSGGSNDVNVNVRRY